MSSCLLPTIVRNYWSRAEAQIELALRGRQESHRGLSRSRPGLVPKIFPTVPVISNLSTHA